jgi:MOB kinase activator 1
MSKTRILANPLSQLPEAHLTLSRFEYLWQDNENYKRPTKMAAPAYIEQLMTWVQANIDNESVMPSKIGT